MAAQSRSERDGSPTPTGRTPPIAMCQSCPGTYVFLEAGNTEGWIATDAVVATHR